MKRILILVFIILSACSKEVANPLTTALESKHKAIVTVIDSVAQHEVQIIFTQIDTKETGETIFTDHTFQLDNHHYFYPASTVKLPAAVLALELADSQRNYSPYTAYSSSRDTLKHSIADDVRQIFAISDNEAYNRLYELLGRDYINNTLRQKGLGPLRISHRLSTTKATEAEHGFIQFDGVTGTPKRLFDNAIETISLQNQQKGKGFIKNDMLIMSPMDFSEKNYFPLLAQHELMKRLFFPKNFSKQEGFNLSKESRSFLIEQMHTLPKDNGYNRSEYYDSYGKFFMFGDSKEPMPKHIKIYNKVGYAYGTLTDTAFIVDEKENVRFFISATILVNKNAIFNDDNYEYNTIGMPFLAQLGRELHELEKKRAH